MTVSRLATFVGATERAWCACVHITHHKVDWGSPAKVWDDKHHFLFGFNLFKAPWATAGPVAGLPVLPGLPLVGSLAG